MIAFVNGIVKIIRSDRVVLDVHGVGYEVYLANALSQKKDEELFLYTYQHVREDAILLFGFLKEEDYEVFMRLINVKGIGPKTAQTMLSVCSGKEMIEAIENDDIKIFTLDMVGLSENACTILLEYFVMLYNGLTNTKDAYEDNGNVLGIVYDKEDKKIDSQFEKLDFNEKLDVFSEIIIRYDNETYFDKKITIISFDSKSSGFDIANMIKKYKN